MLRLAKKIPRTFLLNILFFIFLSFTSLISTYFSWQSREYELDELNWGTNQYGLGCDPSRFLLQGHWLHEGRGFRDTSDTGRLCTSLPPGHPYVLSLLFLITDKLDRLRYIQCLIPLLSGLLIFFSLKHFLILRYLSSLIISSTPWLTALSSCHMSETTSTFFVALLIFATTLPLNRLPVDSHRPNDHNVLALHNFSLHAYLAFFAFFLAGFCASAAILTAPGLTFSVLSLLIVLSVRFKRKWNLLFLGVVGFFIPLGYWQIHCIYAEGYPVVTLLTPLDASLNVEKAWVCTWARTPEETMAGYSNFAWNIDNDFSDVPDYAFFSETEKNEIISAYKRTTHSNVAQDSFLEANKERHRIIAKATLNRGRQQPFEVYIWLPLQRGILSWLKQQPVSYHGHDSPLLISRLLPWNVMSEMKIYGLYRVLFRVGRGLFALFVLLIHYGTIMLVAYAAIKSWKAMPLGTTIILSSVFLYTYLHGLSGPECRRNLPFYPLLLALPAIASTSSTIVLFKDSERLMNRTIKSGV
jgi:hypothetical protein